MNKEARAYCLIRRKIAATEYAENCGNVSKACRTRRMSRAGFYRWKKRYDEHGEDGLTLRKTVAEDHPRRIFEATVQKVFELRRSYVSARSRPSGRVTVTVPLDGRLAFR